MDTLFNTDEYVINRQPQTNRVMSQVEICKRCKHSASDNLGAYCMKFDLCIEFENRLALLSKNGQRLSCNKKEWKY